MVREQKIGIIIYIFTGRKNNIAEKIRLGKEIWEMPFPYTYWKFRTWFHIVYRVSMAREKQKHDHSTRINGGHGRYLLYLSFLYAGSNLDRLQVWGVGTGLKRCDLRTCKSTQRSEAEEPISSMTPDPGTQMTWCKVCNNTRACLWGPGGCTRYSQREVFQDQAFLGSLG